MKNTNVAFLIVTVVVLGLFSMSFTKITGEDENIINQGQNVKKKFKKVIKYKYYSDIIVLEGNINKGKDKYNLILDTGAPMVISKSLAEALGLKKLEAKIDNSGWASITGDIVALDNFKFYGLKYTNLVAMVVDYSKMGYLNCLGKDGMVGANLMNKGLVQINYFDSTLTVANNLDKMKYVNDAIPVKFTTSPQGSPSIKVVVNDSITMDLLIDTGHNGSITLASKSFTKSLDKLGSNEKAVSYGKTMLTAKGTDEMQKQVQTYLLKLKSLQLGNEKIENLPVKLDNSISLNDNSGLIGNKFLKHFIITIDWSTSTMYFYRDTRVKLEDNQDSYGLSYVPASKEALMVSTIWENTQAEKVGIIPGDIIVSLNGKKTSEVLQNFDVCAFYRGEFRFTDPKDTSTNITILRNGQEIVFTLQKEKLFK